MTRFINIVYHMLILFLHGCWSSRPPPMALLQPNKLFAIKISCTRELLNVKLDMGKSFKGIIFAKDFSEDCRARGNRSTSIEINLPTTGCGLRSEPRPDGSLELSVRLVIQMDEKLRQRSDLEKMIGCNLPDQMVELNVGTISGKKILRHGRMRSNVQNPDAENTSQRMRVWLELGGVNGSGTVEVGQLTTLGVRAVLPGSVGVRIVDCAALDGLGETSQKLLDDRGCPIDEQVMPALLTRLRPAEEGWSKPDIDDLVEKLYTATFPAFKFPDRERLHISCGVQLCRGPCPNVDCSNNEPFILDAEQQLARIEVFNSLAVIAPQIELDRLRNDRRYNVTIDEYPSARVRITQSEGTLCLSTSKLALAFCILGLIFLIAVVVAICCLIWGKSKSKSSHWPNGTNSVLREANTSVFSSSSGSQSRLGGRLLIPYMGGSLPYGRVY